MKKIFIFDNTGQREWHVGIALCEDGTFLASHCSSSIGFCKHDMGLFPDQCKWKHDLYEKHCPDGYELEWVDNPKTHEGLKAAYELNQAAERAAVEVHGE